MAVKNRWIGVLAGLGACTLVLAACGGDDGDSVRDSTARGASGSGSVTGRSSSDVSETDNELVNAAVTQYKQYVERSGRRARRGARPRSPTRCGPATSRPRRRRSRRHACRGSASSRSPGWSPDIDGAIDARVDDFAGRRRPDFTGWHRLEYLLWEKNTTEGGAPFADQLDADLATLKEQVADARGHAGRRGRTARPSSSRRSPRARSPARRTATRRPTCGTSPPTSQGSQAADRHADAGARGGRPRAARRRSTPASPSSTPCAAAPGDG